MTTVAPRLDVDAIPLALRKRDQWVLWRLEPKKDKPGELTKVPYTDVGRKASANDPRTWLSFAEALRRYHANPNGWSGIGYEFSKDDPYTGIDLDSCLEAGAVKPWAQAILDELMPTYAEVSPSGTGIKLWLETTDRHTLGGGADGHKNPAGQVEVYSDGRFFAVTGAAIDGAPGSIARGDDETIGKIIAWERKRRGRAQPERKVVQLQQPSAYPTMPLPELVALLDSLASYRWASYGDWLIIGMALHDWAAGDTHRAATAYALYDQYSRERAPEHYGETADKWATFGRRDAGEKRVTVGTLKHWAREDAAGAPEQPMYSSLIPAGQLGGLKPISWLIPRVLGRGLITQVFGKPGTGKSLVVLDQALTIAQFAPVVYVAGEAVSELHDRIQAWCDLYGRSPGALYVWPEAVNLRDDAALAAVAEASAQIGAVAIVVDPLAECMAVGGLNENEPGDMSTAVAALRRIVRDAGNPALLLVHHAGWNDAHERGHSILRGACRVVLRLTSDENDGRVTLATMKANNGKPFEERYFTLVNRRDSVVLLPRSRTSEKGNAPLARNQVRILEALTLIQHASGATFADLVDTTELAKSSVKKAVDTLMRRDMVRQDGRHFCITEQGSIALEAIAKNDTHAAAPLAVTGSTFNWAVTADTASSPEFTSSSPRFTTLVNRGELGGELFEDEAVSPRPNAEFTEFTVYGPETAKSSPLADDASSPEFTSAAAAECGSSPEFTISSPPSSPPSSLVHPPRGPIQGPEVNQSEPISDGEPDDDPFAAVRQLVADGDDATLGLYCYRVLGRRLDDVKAEARRRWPELLKGA